MDSAPTAHKLSHIYGTKMVLRIVDLSFITSTFIPQHILVVSAICTGRDQIRILFEAHGYRHSNPPLKVQTSAPVVKVTNHSCRMQVYYFNFDIILI